MPKPQIRLPLLWLFGAVVMAAKTTGAAQNAYATAHPVFTIGLPAVFCLMAAIYLALAFAPAIRVRPVLGYFHLAAMLLGAVLIQYPSVALRLAGSPRGHDDPSSALAAWSSVAAVGYAVLLASLLWFAYVVFDGWRRGKAPA